jgi:hypothetical protein
MPSLASGARRLPSAFYLVFVALHLAARGKAGLSSCPPFLSSHSSVTGAAGEGGGSLAGRVRQALFQNGSPSGALEPLPVEAERSTRSTVALAQRRSGPMALARMRFVVRSFPSLSTQCSTSAAPTTTTRVTFLQAFGNMLAEAPEDHQLVELGLPFPGPVTGGLRALDGEAGRTDDGTRGCETQLRFPCQVADLYDFASLLDAALGLLGCSSSSHLRAISFLRHYWPVIYWQGLSLPQSAPPFRGALRWGLAA